MRGVFRLTVIVWILGVVSLPRVVSAADVQPVFDPSGLQIVSDLNFQFKPANEEQAVALNGALELGLSYPDDFGYPYVDEQGLLVVRAVTGVKLPAGADPSHLDGGPFSIRVEETDTSITQLSEVADQLTRLTEEEVVGAKLIWMTVPDYTNNRIITVVSSLDEGLMRSLADKFGTRNLAVHIQNEAHASSAANRQDDTPPFFGGARWTSDSENRTCSTGFAWKVGTQAAMLTAAHCIYDGGFANWPSYTHAGTVAASTEENWSTATGTTFYSGQSQYMGDVALIRMTSLGTGPFVYIGGPNSSSSDGVEAMATRHMQFGDVVQISGQANGSAWVGHVELAGINVKYDNDGPNVYARNVTEADATGSCGPGHGDSGGAAFKLLNDGNLVALGIFSGFASTPILCLVFVTDIRDSWSALPGTLKVL